MENKYKVIKATDKILANLELLSRTQGKIHLDTGKDGVSWQGCICQEAKEALTPVPHLHGPLTRPWEQA